MRPPASPGRGAGLPRRAEGDPDRALRLALADARVVVDEASATSPSAVSAAAFRSGSQSPLRSRGRCQRCRAICNLCSLTKSQDALRRITKAMRDTTGNLPQLPGIFPDQLAPVVRNMESERELTLMRWGFPPPTAQQPACARSGQGTLSF
jgi:hypothetical protein